MNPELLLLIDTPQSHRIGIRQMIESCGIDYTIKYMRESIPRMAKQERKEWEFKRERIGWWYGIDPKIDKVLNEFGIPDSRPNEK